MWFCYFFCSVLPCRAARVLPGKLKPEVTLDDYTAFRGAGLRSSSPSYAGLEALQGQYLRRPPEDHQQELADLAMNGSFVSDLLAVRLKSPLPFGPYPGCGVGQAAEQT